MTNGMLEETPGPVVSSPVGSFDQAARDALELSIREHTDQENRHHIIDLRAVAKVDAATVRTMIKINRNLSEVGGTVALIIDNPKALRYIKLTALERVFRVYPTHEAALAGVTSDGLGGAHGASTGDAQRVREIE